MLEGVGGPPPRAILGGQLGQGEGTLHHLSNPGVEGHGPHVVDGGERAGAPGFERVGQVAEVAIGVADERRETIEPPRYRGAPMRDATLSGERLGACRA